VFSYLQNKESVKTLFGEIAGRTTDRPGGYTRIIKLSDARLGDAADMCLMELVDFNDLYKKDGAAKKTKTRRSRGAKKDGAEANVEAAATEEKPKKAAKKVAKKKD
jgi:large subunit ribosomal protein L17